MNSNSIEAIILASGFGKRFTSGNKLLYNIYDKPIAEHVISAAVNCKLISNVTLVYNDVDVSLLANNINVKLIYNEHPEKGVRESIRLGTLNSAADFYLFLLGDMPFISAQTICDILVHREHGKIIQPFFNNIPGNPCLFPNVFRDELLNLNDGESGKDIIKAHTDCVKKIELKTNSIIRDIDYITDVTN